MIVALAGLAGSGKNTAASMIRYAAHPRTCEEIAFADPLKKFCQEVFDFSDAQVYGPSEERNRPDNRYEQAPCDWCSTAHYPSLCKKCGGKRSYLTPRHALQTLGTEWGRACYENVWADLGVRRALASPADIVLITDCRFINEARAVRETGGEVWLVARMYDARDVHLSETEQQSTEFCKLVSRTVLNTGTLEDLRATCAQLVSRLPF